MSSPIVKVNQGFLRGCYGENYDGDRFYKFLGIPYAQPPIGYLRFKAPRPVQTWTGIRNATKEGNRCYSRDEQNFQLTGSEDCLYLNVFTKQLPKCNAAKLMPVMVWIHGGAFVSGTSSPEVYGPEFLMTEDIVFVSINYRLGVLGFLSLKDTSLGVPGNAGMKDQTLALKWVKENIINFGGDPDNVTLFGESAGATSVHYHILSPLSKGLFHKAILQSGSALNSWAVTEHDVMSFIEKLNKAVVDEREALELLKKIPFEQLYVAQEEYSQGVNTPSKICFGPVIESSSVEGAFITKNPLEIIQSGEYNHVPIVFGYNDREGMLFEGVKRRTPNYNPPNPDLEDLIPWHLNIEKGSEKCKEIVRKIENAYFRNSEDELQNKILFLTDQAFVAGIIASVENHRKTTTRPLYLYRMSLETSLNFYKKLCKMEELPGVSHADELGYLFKSFVTPEGITTGSIEDTSIRKFVNLWTSFAKTGSFDIIDNGLKVDWKPISNCKLNYLILDKQLSTDINPDNERINVWREIYRMSDSPLVVNFL